LGKWSVIIDFVDIEELEPRLKAAVRRVQREIRQDHTTPQDVTSSLNIIPAFIENSLFWTFSTSPAEGTVG
jgi:predicted DNA-binding ArsR family transcriptional regulator